MIRLKIPGCLMSTVVVVLSRIRFPYKIVGKITFINTVDYS